MRLSALAFTAVVAALLPGAAAQGACQYFMAPLGVQEHALSVQDRRTTFLRTWELVRDYYYDPAVLRKANWAAVRERFVQKALGAPTDADFYAVLNQMVATVNAPWDQFVWTKAQNDYYARGIRPPAGIGVLMELQDAKGLRIREVLAGSAAERAGIRKGDLITAISGNACLAPELLRGEEGSTIGLTVRSADGTQRDLSVERAKVATRMSPAEARVLNGNVAYVFLKATSIDGLNKAFEETISAIMQPAAPKGVILDVRGLGDASFRNIEGVLGEFVIGHVGSYKTWHGSQEGVIPVPGKHFDQLAKVPLVVLVDEDTAVDGEYIAAILQATGRAKVVGSRTAGYGILTDLLPLPDGGVVGVATKLFVLPDGTPIHGRGVTPDVLVPGHWHDFTPDTDPVIAKALAILQGT